MKKNYYYNGFKVRSSNNDYKFALLKIVNGTFKTCKCSKSYEACLNHLDYITKAEELANQDNITIHEAWCKYHLWSSQCEERKNYIIVELEQR